MSSAALAAPQGRTFVHELPSSSVLDSDAFFCAPADLSGWFGVPNAARATGKEGRKGSRREMARRLLQPTPLLPLAVLIPLLLLVMHCAGGCRAAADRRAFGDTVPKSDRAAAAVVREVPRRGQGAAQAYTVAAAAAEGGKSNEGWAPIRIVVFTEDLEEKTRVKGKQRYCKAAEEACMNYLGQEATCTARDVLTDAKKELYKTKIIPEAVKLHAERLLVQPVAGNIVVPRNPGDNCQHFTIPTGHKQKGVADADMVLYAAAGPFRHDVPAWAATCVTLDDSRPFVGAMEFNPAYMTDLARSVRVAAHELAHALGFSHEAMQLKGMVGHELHVRGVKRKLVTGATVMARAAAHFSCGTLKGMELEQDDTGGVQAKVPHWEGRNAKDELMAPTVGAGYYTALTLAVFADLGYYRVNWGMAEPMRWGNNSGCGFLEKKCNEIDGLAATYPHMFCDDTDTTTLRCSSDRRHLGTCTASIVEQSGSLNERDVCPVVSMYFNHSTYGKTSNACAEATAATLPGSVTGSGSWCLDAETLQVKANAGDKKLAGVCAQVLCEDGAVKVKYSGSDAWHECPAEKEIEVESSDFEDGGKIKCPRYAEVCTIAANGSSLVIPRAVLEEAKGDAEEDQKGAAAGPEEGQDEEEVPAREPQPAELPSGTAGVDPSSLAAAAEVAPGTSPAAEAQERAKEPDGAAHSAAASPPPAGAAPSPGEAAAAKESDAAGTAGAAAASPDAPAPPTPTPAAAVNISAVQKKLDGAAQHVGSDASAAAAAFGCGRFVLLAVAVAVAAVAMPPP
ncbi:surface protease GP63 [Trypanosoma conorhini]|uniref:Leishmanolysin-like peptidase n=1 Tax=Trypanosoma conorhini TaxID=83891 RepID=A0A3R7N5C4_9TRYP|nr:surface protease GP63 [Trypanosoma conorhini]RNE96752.1 surface protease GP63 [Trypanosoma conorhini]